MTKTSDQWRTPLNLFNELNLEFKFTHDLCADENNKLCEKWFHDYLTQEFKNGVGFCNPPYSNPKPFIEKAWEDSKHCKIVLLVKVDPSTKWWGIFWNYTKQYKYQRDFEPIGPKPGCEVRFLPKRVKFDPPLGWEGKISGPSFPSCILIFDRRGL